MSKKSGGYNQDNGKGYIYHPFEISISGYSNSGKTTLITRLIENLSTEYDIGYIKHGVDKFVIDHEGKDTQRAWSSGASRLSISDSQHSAYIHKEPPTQLELKYVFIDCDFVFIEGSKSRHVNKIVLIDDKKEILDSVSQGEIGHVIGFAGQDKAVTDLPVKAPYFHWDDVSGISLFIRRYLSSMAKKTPLFGLVLTGGSSNRMKKDKALLEYHGKPQARVIYNLLSKVCKRVYISSRKDQWQEGLLKKFQQIHDVFLGLGPLSGILSAMHANPDAAWLVVACDLPFVDRSTIEVLLKNRNPLKMATCFKNAHNRFPEPLCTIYEPKMRLRFIEHLGSGSISPREILRNSPVIMLDQADKRTLENVNSIEEYQKAKSDLSGRVK